MNFQIVALVEDNSDDQLLMKRVFRQAQVLAELVMLDDGQQAVNYFENEANPLPVLILLDLNLPLIPGLTVLERLRQNKRTAACPVIVLTVSDRQQDVVKSYQTGANGFVSKPIEPDTLRTAIRDLGLSQLLGGQFVNNDRFEDQF